MKLEISSQTRRGSGTAQDLSAIALSMLCAVHCALMPAMLGLLPAGLLWLENEWVHQVFVLVAVPISGSAIIKSLMNGSSTIFSVSATLGLVLLVPPVVIEGLHSYEDALTLSGAALLAGAHIARWLERHEPL